MDGVWTASSGSCCFSDRPLVETPKDSVPKHLPCAQPGGWWEEGPLLMELVAFYQAGCFPEGLAGQRTPRESRGSGGRLRSWDGSVATRKGRGLQWNQHGRGPGQESKCQLWPPLEKSIRDPRFLSLTSLGQRRLMMTIKDLTPLLLSLHPKVPGVLPSGLLSLGKPSLSHSPLDHLWNLVYFSLGTHWVFNIVP